MYSKAPNRGRVTATILYGIRYAGELEGRMTKAFVLGAGLPENHYSEIRKGMNLSKYVDLNDSAGAWFVIPE